MRLVSLDLHRYGPFTGKRLAFRPDAKLHVVHGPNEAGKTCALAAVTDLLFGIEARTRFDFEHEGKTMRIGAEIAARNGRRLTFARRKGNRATLLAADGSPLPDDALTAFFGGLTRQVFCNAFGLNARNLRDGAEEMLHSDGEVGATLLAAASGLPGLTELGRTLEREADAIFAARASKDRRFYRAIDAHEAARKEARELELKGPTWIALNLRIDDLAENEAQADRDRDALVRERTRLERMKRLAPMVAPLDADLAALEALGPLPETPAGFAARLRVALEAERVATVDLELRRGEAEAAARARDAIAVDHGLLSREADILRLADATGKYEKGEHDLPGVRRQRDEDDSKLGSLATRLGLTEQGDLETRQPPDAAKALVRTLITSGRTIRDELANAKKTLREEERRRDDLQAERGAGAALPDPKPLSERFEALTPVLGELNRRADLDRALRAGTGRIAAAAARLDPPATDFAALAELALPTADVIARFGSDMDGFAETLRAEMALTAQKRNEADAARARMQALESGGPVATPAAIAAARAQRETHWLRLRDALTGSPGAPHGVERMGVIAQYDRLVAEADRLADAAVGDAQRIADHAGATRSLAEAEGLGEAARTRGAAIEAQLTALDADWRSVWDRAGIDPRPPAAMLVWANAFGALVTRHDELRVNRAELAVLDERIAAIRAPLSVLAADLGLPPMPTHEVDLVAGSVEAALRKLKAGWDGKRDIATKLADAHSRVLRGRAAVEAAEAARRDWDTQWTAAVAIIGLSADAALEQAEAVLRAWDEAPAAIRERDDRQRRIAGLGRDAEDFRREVAALAGEVAADLADKPAEVAAKTMRDRSLEARTLAARREAAQALAVEAQEAVATAERAMDAARRAGADLRKLLAHSADPAELCDPLAERERLLTELASRRRQILMAADNLDEAAIRAELAGYDRGEVEARMTRLTHDEDAVNARAKESFAEHLKAVRERDDLAGGVGSEVAVQRQRNAEVDIAAAARDWSVLSLAGVLLKTAMQRHRTGRQDPLVRRAGALFADLTHDAFSGLVEEDDDVPRLCGQRSNGKTVPMEGLSEGTRDQLYLALRLAYLEDYAQRAEPAPFIGDDLFATFDDRRTAAGLSALAGISAHVQPILFTHHRHVADAALATLGADAEILDLA